MSKMKCFYHNEREATCTCVGCGKGLCSPCGSISKPQRCADCLTEANRKEYNSFLYTAIVSAFFFFITAMILVFTVGVSAFRSPMWWFLMAVVATIPWGWRFLHSLFPVFFLSTSILLMILALIFTALLSFFAGIVVMPWQIFSIIRLYARTRAARKRFFEST
ncbi:MAG: hypothetical protein JW817_02325 [Clostridiales bacterium]|nr:hypothetical protein [Clostridiales bacterium]